MDRVDRFTNIILMLAYICFAPVSLRKKGRSKASFAVQFAGVVGIGLTILLYTTLTGSILEYLN